MPIRHAPHRRLLPAFWLAMPWLVVLLGVAPALGAELAVLTDENWSRLAAPGGEADGILDDYSMSNDLITVVIGNPELLSGRSTSRSSGMKYDGCVIDMTTRTGRRAGNDRLAWFSPGPQLGPHQPDSVTGRALYKPGYAADFKTVIGKSVTLDLDDTTWLGREIPSTLHYTLEDGKRYITCTVIYENPTTRVVPKRLIPLRSPPEAEGDKLQEMADEPRGVGADKGLVTMPDEPAPPPPLGPVGANPSWGFLVDGVVEKGFDPEQQLTWFYDKWFGQAYAVLEEPAWTHEKADASKEAVKPRAGGVFLKPGEKLHVTRRLFVGADLAEVRRDVNEFLGARQRAVKVKVTDGRGPTADVDVTATGATTADAAKRVYAMSRTDENGLATCWLPPGKFEVVVSRFGQRAEPMIVDAQGEASFEFRIPPAGTIDVEVTDHESTPIPCKIELRGRDGTPDPYLFPETGERLVRNLIYTTDGKAKHVVPPGKYLAIVTRGPEYDASVEPIEISPGGEFKLKAKLRRGVDSRGWVSVDIHSQSTLSNRPAMSPPSAASTLGRVLNMLAEDIRFAPATEMNKAFTYQPIIESLGATKWLASCGGITLSDNGRKYAYNDQYAFPIEYHPRQQDGGVPQRPQHCGQIEWLRSWGVPIDEENPWAAARQVGYEKCLVLMAPDNKAPDPTTVKDPHTNSTFHDRDVPSFWDDISAHIRPMFRDTDDDGVPDRVHINFARQMDALDVRTLSPLFNPKAHVENDVLHWLLMRANGYRMTGVVSSHATDNFHGSGGVRTYVRSEAENVEHIDPLHVGRQIRAGHAFMTTGPFVEFTAQPVDDAETTAIPGDTLALKKPAAHLWIRAQSANWIALDRVEFWVNGKIDPTLTIDPATAPKAFRADGGGIEHSFNIDLAKRGDTQIIAIVRGHGPNYRRRAANEPDIVQHVAITNPILLDINGDGFVPRSPILETISIEPTLRKPVLSKAGTPPGRVRLVITNHGGEPVRGVAPIEFRPKGVVEPVGRPDLSFDLEPGKSTTIEFNLRLTRDAETDAMIGGGDKPKTTLHILRTTAPPQIASAKLPIIIDSGAALMDEGDVKK